MVGYASNTNNPFYIDKEDFEKISIYYWNENSNGYARTFVDGKEILMYRYILNIEDTNIHVDHRCHNNMDNRKQMLRATTCRNNTMNEKLATNNTSGVTGVSWEEKSSKWHSYIWVNGKTMHLGRYEDFDESVRQRKIAEEKYFGEFSYTNSMKVEG